MARVTFKKGAKVERIEKNLGDPSRALKQIGFLMVAESQRAFKAQRFGDKRWAPRGKVNVFGIIADFSAKKKEPPPHRFETRPALMDSGALAGSITSRVVGDIVEIGTNKTYAGVHQFGGEVESETLTSSVRQALWSWLKKQSAELNKRIGWVLNKKFRDEKIPGRVPARPFLGITPQTRKIVRKVIGVEIMEAK